MDKIGMVLAAVSAIALLAAQGVPQPRSSPARHGSRPQPGKKKSQ